MRYLPLVAAMAVLAALQTVGTGRTAGGDAQDSWGNVTGQVVYGGAGLPEPRKLDVNKDQDHCLSKGPIFSEEWVVNQNNQGVRWAVVWLIPEGSGGKLPVHPSLQAVPKDEKVIDQPCCKFEPHVVALRQGQVLEAKNSAPVPHNVNWAGIKIRGDNKLLPAKGSIKIDDLKATGYAVTIACNIHPWMKAYAWVFDHPYFAVTDENGRFEIKQAPAGKYRIVVWHEASGYRGGDKSGQPIEIQAGKPTDVGKLDVK
jgi:hypothetical protein